jgi:hypothetical protein
MTETFLAIIAMMVALLAAMAIAVGVTSAVTDGGTGKENGLRGTANPARAIGSKAQAKTRKRFLEGAIRRAADQPSVGLERAVVGRLAAVRGWGESYSDVILRLSKG